MITLRTIKIKSFNLLKAQGLDLYLNPPSIDQLILNRKGVVEASDALKRAGFDYSISKDVHGKELLVKFNYKLFRNGIFEAPQFTTYKVPLSEASIDEIKNQLFETAMKIYNGNNQNSTQYFKQNAEVTPNDINELLKKYNYK